jgi:NAD(P)-dependent dehydrogenase (short-subunit alcohol dehydrogenase family)
VAVVTGTTSGIGLTVARVLLDHGWRVLGIARRPSEVTHEAYEHMQLDLCDLGALDDRLAPRLTRTAEDASLRRVGLVNNAAHPALLGPVASLDARRLPGVFTANVAAPVWLMSALVRRVPASVSLRIVNVSSGAALRAIPGLAGYSSSKAALRMTGMVLGAELEADEELRNRPISILSYEPGAVDTSMQALARSQPTYVLPSRDLFVRYATEHRLVAPEVPAQEIVAFLESDSSERFSESRLGDT